MRLIHLNSMYQKLLLVLITLLSICSCTSYKSEIVPSIERELVQIEQKAPNVQEHVDNIRSELPAISKLEAEKSSLEKWLPWVIVLCSIGYGVWGYSTQDIEDTIGGAVGVAVGIAVAVFWNTLAWIGLGMLILFIVLWGICSYDWKKTKRKKNE